MYDFMQISYIEFQKKKLVNAELLAQSVTIKGERVGESDLQFQSIRISQK